MQLLMTIGAENIALRNLSLDKLLLAAPCVNRDLEEFRAPHMMKD
jgi:hypothetical protein